MYNYKEEDESDYSYYSGERPVILTIISILTFLGGLVMIVIGAVLLVGGTMLIQSILDAMSSEAPGAVQPVVGMVLPALSALMFVFAGINMILAVGMWKGWRPVRYVMLFLYAINLIVSVVLLVFSGFNLAFIVGLAVNALFIWYFCTSDVREYFGC